MAITLCDPVTDEGTANVAVKLPLESAVILDGFVLTAVPSYDIVIVELGAKLEPVTVTLVPTAPVVGFSDKDAGGVTVSADAP